MWDTTGAFKKNKHPYSTDRINSISNKMYEFLFEFDARD